MRACRRLEALRVAHTSVRFGPNETVFAKGDRSAAVMYIQTGRVKLSVTSPAGREAVVAVLRAGTFFGEAALARQPRRTSTALTMIPTTVAVVTTAEMRRRLHDQAAFADWFRSHLLARNLRIEADLVGELFDHSEQRLARLLLLLASFDEHQLVCAPLPVISRNLLAELVGTTRWKIDALMNGFRKLGFLERHTGRDGGFRVHRSMLTVVLQDGGAAGKRPRWGCAPGHRRARE
jgi:CRP/FNR family transcriptional regulator, cyclic AMP receptor protein